MRGGHRVTLTPLAIAGLAVLIRAGVAVTDHRTLISAGVFQDDAFYYLTIARNWLDGLGPTFDGVTATNGFHPMLMMLVLPIVSWAGDDPAAPIHAVGLLLSLFAGGSVWLVFEIVRDWVQEGADDDRAVLAQWAAATAAALVAVSPYFVVHSVNGQETGIALFFVLALLRAEQCWLGSAKPVAWARAAGFGALAGLGVLARVDTALLVAAIGTTWMVRAIRRHTLTPAAKRALLAAAVAIALWLPWGIASKVEADAWVPTSGAASREIALNLGWLNLRPIWRPEQSGGGRLFDPQDPPTAWYADVATEQLFVMLSEQPLLAPLRLTTPFTVWPALSRYAPYRLFATHPLPALASLAVTLVAVAWLVVRRTKTPHAGPGQTFTIWLYAVAMFFAYTLHSPSHWSFARYACLPTVLLMAAGIAGLARTVALSGSRPLRLAAIPLAGLFVGYQAFQLEAFASERLPTSSGGFLEAWESLAANIPEDATVGAFQAGVYGWFSGRQIVNLDGKVNNEAQRALEDGELHRYIASRGIDYILDWEAITHALFARHVPEGAGIGLREVARQRAPTPVVLYRVTRADRH